MAIGVGVVAEGDIEPVAQLDEPGHRVRRRRVHPDPAVPVAGHEREPRVDDVVGDRQVQAVAGGDGRPVGDARAAHRVHAEAQAGRRDGRHVEDLVQVVDVGRDVVVGRGRGPGLGERRPPDGLPARRQQLVGLVLDPAGDRGVGRAAVGWVVLEAAVLGRVVGRRDDDPVREVLRAPAVVAEDRVRDDRGGGVAVGGVHAHVDAVRDEDLQRGPERRLGQGVRVAADEQRPVRALAGAIAADRLGHRDDVGLVERAVERRPAVAGRPERDALGRVGRVRPDVVVRAEQPVQVDQDGGVGRQPGPLAVRHRSMVPHRVRRQAGTASWASRAAWTRAWSIAPGVVSKTWRSWASSS